MKKCLRFDEQTMNALAQRACNSPQLLVLPASAQKNTNVTMYQTPQQLLLKPATPPPEYG